MHMEFFGMIAKGMMAYADFVWGWPLLIGTSFVAVFMSVRLGFFQFTYFGHVMKNTFGKIFDKGSGDGNIKPFKAACTALASTLGVGNIAGVSVAIATGGPGAVFWMWFIAMLGLIVKFSEVTLGLAYREKDPVSGVWHGGFPWYVKNALGKNWRWLSVLWAVVMAAGMMFAPSIQAAEISNAINTAFAINPYVVGITVAVLMAAVLLGGLKSISNFANLVVPFMAVIYIIGAIFVMITNASMIPQAFAMIFEDAFTGTAASGGFAGSTVMLAVRWGLARGIYSNEAGTGTAPLAHSSASVNHPVKQGLWGIFEVFFDTIVVCTMTAMVVMTSGVWDSGATGAALTAAAFGEGFGGNAAAAGMFIAVVIAFFGFTTAVVNAYYGGICLNALGFKGASVKVFYALASIFGIVGAVGALNTVWSTFDFFFGVCVLCNLVVIFVMRDKIVLLVRDYEERLLTQSWDATAADAVERLGLMEKPEDASSLREGVKIS